MRSTHDALAARLTALPIAPDRWQLDVRRFPGWIRSQGDAPPFRPVLVMVLSEDEDLLGSSAPVHPSELRLSQVMEALLSLAELPRLGSLPTVIEVAAPEWVQPLTELMHGRGVQVRACDAAPLVDQAYASLRQRIEDPIADLSLAEASGSTPSLLRGLVEACRAFVGATGWREMNDTDLIEVLSHAPDEMRWFSIMGGTRELGLGYFASFEDYDRLMRTADETRFRARGALWSLLMVPEYDLPIADSDALAGSAVDGRLPRMMRVSPADDETGAAAEHMAHTESLLHAIAQVTPEDIDRGTWTRTVPCAGGTREVRLRLASLLDLDELERLSLTGRTPEQRVQLMLGLAGELTGANRTRLARQVLRESPDEPGAWMLMAEDASDQRLAEAHWANAAGAAERRLPDAGLTVTSDHLGEHRDGLHYLTARLAIANTWWDQGRAGDSIEERTRLLTLDVSDPLDIRHSLIPDLMFSGDDEAAGRLLRLVDFEPEAELLFAEALLVFRREGDGDAAREAWAAACKLNLHVPRYLADLDAIPDRLPGSSVPGDDDHAQCIADILSDAWEATPGAVEWVRSLRRERKQVRKRTKR